ncbi:phage tail tape measure protein [Neorhizobium sp. SOG26]|uniref:phage tail tape measure protein n=1 Tax=Neorhizobium sp. SOG26 TaxID=2060726 RepID=UPI00123786D9|nr:phage tail tape measure protein [Neorhizobium sp. SOG26]
MIRSTTRINQALASVSTKIGEFGKAGIGGVIGGIAAGGIAGIVSQFRDVANSVAEVGDQAKIAGVSLKSFQELKFVAEQNRIGVDALVDGLKELNLRADEFIVTGGGSAAEAFQRLGLNADTLKAKLSDPSALFTEIIGKLSQLDRAAQIRIADEVFGGSGGEVFVKLIEQGEKGIRDTIKAANDLGAVMDDDLIKKAAEVDKKFAAIATNVGTQLKGAIIEAANAFQSFIDKYNAFQLNRRALEVGEAMGGLYGKASPNPPVAPTSKAAPKGSRVPSATDILRQKLLEQRIAGAFDTLPEAQASSSSGSKSSSISQAERERKAVQELITELEEELRLVNATDAAKRAAAASRQAGASATDDERKKIIGLTEAIYQEEEARRRAEEATLLYRDLTRSALDDVWSGIEQNKSSFEIMADVAVNSLKRIADTLIDDVLDSLFQVNKAAGGSGGGGLLGSILGGLFGGGKSAFPAAPAFPSKPGIGLFAKGGIADRPSIFAEAGPEAAVPLPDGRRIPVDLRMQSQPTAAASGKSVIELRLSADLEARILEKAGNQTVSVIRQADAERRNLYANGEPR